MKPKHKNLFIAIDLLIVANIFTTIQAFVKDAIYNPTTTPIINNQNKYAYDTDIYQDLASKVSPFSIHSDIIHGNDNDSTADKSRINTMDFKPYNESIASTRTSNTMFSTAKSINTPSSINSVLLTANTTHMDNETGININNTTETSNKLIEGNNNTKVKDKKNNALVERINTLYKNAKHKLSHAYKNMSKPFFIITIVVTSLIIVLMIMVLVVLTRKYSCCSCRNNRKYSPHSFRHSIIEHFNNNKNNHNSTFIKNLNK